MRYSGLVQVDLEDAEESGMLCQLRRLVRATCWLFRHWYLTYGLWELMALLPVLSVSAGTSHEVLPGPMSGRVHILIPAEVRLVVHHPAALEVVVVVEA